jgi:hypothetical protein
MKQVRRDVLVTDQHQWIVWSLYLLMSLMAMLSQAYAQGADHLRIQACPEGIHLSWDRHHQAELYAIYRSEAMGEIPRQLAVIEDTFFVDQEDSLHHAFYELRRRELNLTVRARERCRFRQKEERWSEELADLTVQLKGGDLSWRQNHLGDVRFGVEGFEHAGDWNFLYGPDHELLAKVPSPSFPDGFEQGFFAGSYSLIGSDPDFSWALQATQRGWSVQHKGEELVLEQNFLVGDRLIEQRLHVDEFSGQLRRRVSLVEERRTVQLYDWTEVGGLMLLAGRSRFVYQGETLLTQRLYTYSDHRVNEEELAIDPEGGTTPFLPDMEKFFARDSLQIDSLALYSPCPHLREVESPGGDLARNRELCMSCHDEEPGALVALVHGLNSNAAEMALLRRWFNDHYDVSVITPEYARELGAFEASANLGERLASLGIPVQVALGHSLGGLLLERSMQTQDEMVLAQLLTLGSPLHGAALADNADYARERVDNLIHDGRRALDFTFWFIGSVLFGLPLDEWLAFVLDGLEDRLGRDLDELMDAAAIPDIQTDSAFIAALRESGLPENSVQLGTRGRTTFPLHEILASWLTRNELLERADDISVDWSDLDEEREDAYRMLRRVWNVLAALTRGPEGWFGFWWPDPLDDFHWSLTHINLDWYRGVLECEGGSVPVEYWEVYPIGEGPDASVWLHCPQAPEAIVSGFRTGAPLESCCRFLGDDQDLPGCALWHCYDCGSANLIRCFWGTGYIPELHEHDGIVRALSQLPIVEGDTLGTLVGEFVSHQAQSRSTAVLQELPLILEEFGLVPH